MDELPVDIDQIIFDVEFQIYLDYIEFMERFLDTEQKRESTIIREHLIKWGEADTNIGDIPYLTLTAAGLLPGKIAELSGLLRSSFFVNLYSYFENKLISECRDRKTDGILLDFDDIRGVDVIERVKKYFTKVLRVKFPDSTPEWEIIQNYRIIRNCIVHAQGRIDELRDKKERDKLQRFVHRNKNVSLVREQEDLIALFRRNGEIYIHQGFCEEACNTIKAVLKMILFPSAIPKF